MVFQWLQRICQGRMVATAAGLVTAENICCMSYKECPAISSVSVCRYCHCPIKAKILMNMPKRSFFFSLKTSGCKQWLKVNQGTGLTFREICFLVKG